MWMSYCWLSSCHRVGICVSAGILISLPKELEGLIIHSRLFSVLKFQSPCFFLLVALSWTHTILSLGVSKLEIAESIYSFPSTWKFSLPVVLLYIRIGGRRTAGTLFISAVYIISFVHNLSHGTFCGLCLLLADCVIVGNTNLDPWVYGKMC